MTPLAMKIAKQLTLPAKQRTFENQDVLAMFGQDMHCFDISAIAKPIDDAMSEENVWPDIGLMLPGLFLPSPITWLEFRMGNERHAYVLTETEAGWFSATVVRDGKRPFAIPFANFRPCSVLQSPDLVEINLDPLTVEEVRQYEAGYAEGGRDAAEIYNKLPTSQAKLEGMRLDLRSKEWEAEKIDRKLDIAGVGKHIIAFSVMALDLINKPGLVGFKQHAPHVGLARQFAKMGAGSYPLRSWSEVTVKTHTKFDGGDYESGATFRKCLHFVRSHRRRYRSGRETVIPAHWRGDPALGIKRTRYRVTA